MWSLVLCPETPRTSHSVHHFLLPHHLPGPCHHLPLTPAGCLPLAPPQGCHAGPLRDTDLPYTNRGHRASLPAAASFSNPLCSGRLKKQQGRKKTFPPRTQPSKSSWFQDHGHAASGKGLPATSVPVPAVTSPPPPPTAASPETAAGRSQSCRELRSAAGLQLHPDAPWQSRGDDTE